MTATPKPVPDTDQELVYHLGVFEEVLLAIVPFDDGDRWSNPPAPAPAPAPAGLGLGALDAVQRVGRAVAAAERTATPRLLAADGGFELVPLRLVVVDDADLAALGAAVAALGLTLLLEGDEGVRDVLEGFGDKPDRAGDLVADFAWAHGLLDLAGDDDTRLLIAVVDGAAGTVVLHADARSPTGGSPTGHSASSISPTCSPVSSTGAPGMAARPERAHLQPRRRARSRRPGSPNRAMLRLADARIAGLGGGPHPDQDEER